MKACVKIRLFAMFKEIVGKKEISYDVQRGTTLGEILNMLAKEYGEDFKETVDKKTGQVDINTLVMLNGQNMRNTNVKLQDNDQIIITVPVGGGYEAHYHE